MAKRTFAAALLILGLVPALALAAKPAGSSSIELVSVQRAGSASTSLTAPRLGDTIAFATTVEQLPGWEYPMVAVSCYQDVNGDGNVDTNLLGPDVVFTWLDHPDASVTLGGYMSIWTLRGGGPAVCRADLDAYGWKGGRQSIRVLATTGHWAVSG